MKQDMTKSTPTDGAALARELAYLADLPQDVEGAAPDARFDEVQRSVARLPARQRMPFFTAAVSKIDCDFALGPYPDFQAGDLTPETFAFEDFRLRTIYYSMGPDADLARRLLVVLSPLFRTYSLREQHTFGRTSVLLITMQITAEDFPDFRLREYLRARGELDAWDAEFHAGHQT